MTSPMPEILQSSLFTRRGLSESITGSSFYGIGIYCRSQDDDGLLVMGFTDDSAAKEEGLKEGDEVIVTGNVNLAHESKVRKNG